MQVISYDNRLLNKRGIETILRNEERIADAYRRFLEAPAKTRGSKMHPIAIAVGKKYRLYFSEDSIIVRKARLAAGTVTEVGEVRL